VPGGVGILRVETLGIEKPETQVLLMFQVPLVGSGLCVHLHVPDGDEMFTDIDTWTAAEKPCTLLALQ
jgi:hypothetical protein